MDLRLVFLCPQWQPLCWIVAQDWPPPENEYTKGARYVLDKNEKTLAWTETTNTCSSVPWNGQGWYLHFDRARHERRPKSLCSLPKLSETGPDNTARCYNTHHIYIYNGEVKLTYTYNCKCGTDFKYKERKVWFVFHVWNCSAKLCWASSETRVQTEVSCTNKNK